MKKLTLVIALVPAMALGQPAPTPPLHLDSCSPDGSFCLHFLSSPGGVSGTATGPGVACDGHGAMAPSGAISAQATCGKASVTLNSACSGPTCTTTLAGTDGYSPQLATCTAGATGVQCK